MFSKRTLLEFGLLTIFLIAAGKGLWELGRIIWLEAQGPLDADSTVYFMLGRTILNGFRLYVDFFDVQPPGIFLLTALSLLVTGNERLTTVFVVFILAAIPSLLTFFAYRESRSRDVLTRALLMLLALILGILLTLYLEERAPTVETEMFGSFFGVLFAIVTITYPDHFDWKRSLLNALFLLCSIGMKEPFLVANLAVALLLARNKKHFFYAFLLPLGMGGVLGILILLWMGIFLPYIESLRTTFAFRSANTARIYGPMLIRPLAIHMLHANMSLMYTASPMLAYLVWYLWSRSIEYRMETKRSFTSVLILVAAFGSGALFMNTIHQVFLVQYLNVQEVLLRDPNLLTHAIMEMVAAILILLPSAFWLHRQKMLRWLFVSLAALACTSLAVGSSEYSGNHFAFAVPVLAALMLLFLRESARSTTKTPAFLLGSALTMIVMLPFAANPNHLASLRSRMANTYAMQKDGINKIDGLMENCGLKQYYNEAVTQFAMARHSPFGPLVMQYDYLPISHTLQIRTAATVQHNAQLIVATEDYDQPTTKQLRNLVVSILHRHIPKEFTKDVPPCAASFVPIEGVTLWFRKDLFSKIPS